MKRTNLQQLADQLGLARSTVSRALRDDPLIAAATRRRVKEAADQLGYRSNPYLSVLMSRLRHGAPPSASAVIAFLNPQSTRNGWRNRKSLLAAVTAASARAKELGFDLQEFWLGEPGMTPQRLTEILLTRGIRALVLGAPGDSTQQIPFDTRGFAAVGIDLGSNRTHLHRATCDYLGSTRVALQALRDLGYRRIGLALDRETFERMQQQPRMAFLNFEESLPRSDRTGCWIGDYGAVGDFATWLADARPDAIVTAADIPQVWLNSLGFRVPEDIAVAQLDPDFVSFPLSGVDGQFATVGRNAIDLLVSQINRSEFNPPDSPMHVTVPGIWQAGASTLDRTKLPPAEPYDSLRLALCRAAAVGNLDHLARLRREWCARAYGTPFRLAERAPAEHWQCLSLGAAANHPFHIPLKLPHFTERQHIHAPAGRQVLRGVPFQIPVSRLEGEPTVIHVPAETGTAAAPNSLRRVWRVPLGRRVHAVYFLHLACYLWRPAAIAQYRLTYAGGRNFSADLLPYWPPQTGADAAGVQDVWAGMPQFDSASAKPVFMCSDRTPFVHDSYFYAYELRNPSPEETVTSIEIVSKGHPWAELLVVALTALLAD